MDGPDEKTIDEIGPIWRELWGGVWHTTRPDRFLSILDAGAVIPNPPDTDHDGTLAQSLGGVSLFDFRDFDPPEYEEKYQLSMWRSFVPYRKMWAGAVWLEVDHESVGEAFIPPDDLIQKWLDGKDKPGVLPRLEAAHVGRLTLSRIHRVLFIRARDKGKFHEFGWPEFDRDAYEALLPEWREDFKFVNLSDVEKFRLRPPTITGAPDNPGLAERMAEAEERVKKFRRSHT